MTSDEAAARSRLAEEFAVPRGTIDALAVIASLVRAESQHQNLVSAATIDQIWNRHIFDSAQLLRFAPPEGRWLDLGTGAGFPGLVIAILWPGRVTMVEQRRLRADFLERAIAELGVADRAQVLCSRVERVGLPPFDAISARAFAPLPRLLDAAHHLAHKNTIWLLPKGRNAKTELEAARASWQGEFRLEPSWTDPDAFIIVADRVRRIAQGRRGR
jgi:16S rRNA (guanine527-N7)-methyltransferase